MMTDPIADMLIRIKNAYLAHKETVVMPHSKVKEAIATVLLQHKYVSSIDTKVNGAKKDLILALSYTGRQAALTDIKRVSKPGRRMYSDVSSIKRTLGGYGITIVSTSQGVMDDKAARKRNIGGEVLCQVW